MVENKEVHELRMDNQFSEARTLNVIRTVALKCKALGGPLTNQLCNLLMQKRYLEVIDFEIDYTWAFSLEDFRYARQVQALVAKVDFLDLGFDRSERTLQKFLLSERMCREANHRIYENHPSGDVASVSHYAFEKISDVLGDAPAFSELKPTFGPGANTSVRGEIACARTKLSAKPVCNLSLLPQLNNFVKETCLGLAGYMNPDGVVFHPWSISNVELGFGVLSEVPKSSKENRTIVVEPLISSFGQKAVGREIRKCLRRSGINLNSQVRNQKLALEGSITGQLCTVDLSMASDCFACATVWSLVRHDWVELLDSFRTDSIMIRDPVDPKVKHGPFLLEKFSSMGNGYTFELESLIFFGLAFGVCKHLKLPFDKISVYGDDIIIPREAFALLQEVLTWYGFKINEKKSFSDGPFRESCGCDYYNGQDIRPFYINSLLSYFDLFSMYNFFVRRFEWDLAKAVLTFIPLELQLWGPDGCGDGHLVGEWGPSEPNLSRRRKKALMKENSTYGPNGWEGIYFDTYVRENKYFKKKMRRDWVLPCYTMYARSTLEASDGDLRADPVYSILEAMGFSVSELRDITPIFGANRLLQHFQHAGLTDPYVVRGNTGYKRISIYTLWRGIFCRG